jgi:ribonuclease HI
MFPHYDAEEILRIRIPQTNGEDYIAWHYETTGIFSIRSAYRLALLQNTTNLCSGQQSNKPDGDRPIWDVIWKTKVPQKIKIFTWRLATEALAVQKSRFCRNMTLDPTCSICGREPEDGYHATMRCTKSVALRQNLRNVWDLPDEKELQNSGEEWTLRILNSVNSEMRAKLMMLWWRAWHLRNNIIFGDGKAGIAHSSQFLNNYLSSLSNIKEGILPVDVKGKRPIFELQEIQSDSPSPAKGSQWKPPDTNWLCLSVDASYIKETNVASWGALIRDHNGQVHCSAWGMLSKCATAEMAEAMACLEGIKLSVPLVASGIIIESDCATLIKKISGTEMDRSYTASVVSDIQRLVAHFPSFRFRKISREDNRPAHELARLCRVECSAGVLQGTAPPYVLELALLDCNQNLSSI